MAEPTGFRWQSFFQHATEPVFLLSARRRLLFANRAWETCTGLALASVRGRTCRRLSEEASPDREAAVLAALVPPQEAARGEPAQTRRRAPGTADVWWELSYFPLLGTTGVLGILGRLRPLAARGEPLFVLPEKLVALRGRHAERFRLDEPTTPAMRRAVEQARLAATVRLPVLLTGAAGVGKAWLARAIHQLGPNSAQMFACLDCARLPPEYVAQVLLGGRVTLGTVYLREPVLLPLDVQQRLAAALAQPEGRPRVLAGLRGDLHGAVEAGRLLEELACRLSPLTIHLPSLRERASDLARFVDIFLTRAGHALGQAPWTLSAEAAQIVHAHSWPGNLRELYAVLLAASRHARGERIEANDLPFALRHAAPPVEPKLPLDALLEQAEKRLLELALRLTHGQRTRAAELLGIWQTRLVRRMKHFGLAQPTDEE